MKILISAAETSSDLHGAALLKALRALGGSEVEIDAFGVGGPQLQAEGLKAVVDARELSAMGFVDVVARLPRIFRALRRIIRAAEDARPDIAVVIDYPDFHFRLARKLHGLGIPLIYYIPPKVWVWRKGRIKTLQKLFKKLLCILPFEEDFYRQEGVSAVYVGNPLLDELPLAMSRETARSGLGIKSDERVLLAMPGSRPSEIRWHLELFLAASKALCQNLRALGSLAPTRKLVVLLPFAKSADLKPLQIRIERWMQKEQANSWLDLRISSGNSSEGMVAADFGLIKSGTSTLEAGVLACPHCIVYKTHWFNELLFKVWVRYRGPVGLVNLVAGWRRGEPFLVEELILERARLETIVEEVTKLAVNVQAREEMKRRMLGLRQRITSPSGAAGPSLTAAREILNLVSGLK